jgi:endonuclease YncB( thermonuclease family)
MQTLARIISVMLALSVLGFFAWWTLPPFELKLVWQDDPTPKPKFIPAPPKPPSPSIVAEKATPKLATPAPHPAPAVPPQEAASAPMPKVQAVPPQRTKQILLAREAEEEKRVAALRTSSQSKGELPSDIKRFYGVKVRDGQTLTASGTIIRLAGIHVREPNESCKDADGKDWPCGEQAKGALKRLIRGRSITCALPAGGAGNEMTMRCAVVGIDLSTWMVRRGWAKPLVEGDRSFVEAVQEAKTGRAGLWRDAE